MATNNKSVSSIYLKQNDSREHATFLNFGGNFLILEKLKSNFWVYCEATFPEFTSIIYSCLMKKTDQITFMYNEQLKRFKPTRAALAQGYPFFFSKMSYWLYTAHAWSHKVWFWPSLCPFRGCRRS